MQSRRAPAMTLPRTKHLGFVTAAAGIAVLVLVLVGTPDVQGAVLLAWILILASVTAIAFGLVIGFRREARLPAIPAPRDYLSATWVTLSREAEQLRDTVVPAGEVPTVDGDGLASEERSVGGQEEGGDGRDLARVGPPAELVLVQDLLLGRLHPFHAEDVVGHGRVDEPGADGVGPDATP